MTSTRDFRKDFLTSLDINEKKPPFSSHLLEKVWEYEKLSQRSKNVLRRLKEWKIYPNLLAWYLQCYLDPGIAIYLEEWLFMEKLISLIKKREKFKGQTKKLISLWWLSYIWDQLLIQLTGQK